MYTHWKACTRPVTRNATDDLTTLAMQSLPYNMRLCHPVELFSPGFTECDEQLLDGCPSEDNCNYRGCQDTTPTGRTCQVRTLSQNFTHDEWQVVSCVLSV